MALASLTLSQTFALFHPAKLNQGFTLATAQRRCGWCVLLLVGATSASAGCCSCCWSASSLLKTARLLVNRSMWSTCSSTPCAVGTACYSVRSISVSEWGASCKTFIAHAEQQSRQHCTSSAQHSYICLAFKRHPILTSSTCTTPRQKLSTAGPAVSGAGTRNSDSSMGIRG